MGFLASPVFKLSGIGSGIAAFLKSIPPKVWIAIGIVLAILFAWHVHTGWEKANWNAGFNSGFATEKARLDQARAANVIQAASIAELERDLAAKNAESDARAKALADSKAASDADQARLAALRKADAGKDETLRGIRDGALAKPTCKVPDALTAQLGGL
jgi:hypothetical protein